MKSITLLVLFAVTTATIPPDYELGHHVGQRNVPIAPAVTPEEICLDHIGERCGDCATMLTCLGTTILPKSRSCPAEKRYCDLIRNVCTATPPLDPCDDPLTDSSFICALPNEVFPHPTNCSLFYDCVMGNAYLGECNPKQVWSGIGYLCKDKKVTADCGTFNCAKYPNTLRPYTVNNAYYAYCGPIVNGQQNIVVLKCEYQNYYFVDGICQFECKDARYYADGTDEQWYYRCYRSGTRFLYEHTQCTLNRYFDEATQSCK